jgi:hypothetical protein
MAFLMQEELDIDVLRGTTLVKVVGTGEADQYFGLCAALEDMPYAVGISCI